MFTVSNTLPYYTEAKITAQKRFITSGPRSSSWRSSTLTRKAQISSQVSYFILISGVYRYWL